MPSSGIPGASAVREPGMTRHVITEFNLARL
jgi:hypothetical protein